MLLDNKANGKVGDTLRQNIQRDARLSFITSAFSIYAFTALKTELARIGELQLLLPSNPVPTTAANQQPFS